MNEQKKITLANLQQWVESWVHNCELNHKDPSEVEFVIKDSTERKEYRPFSGYLAWRRWPDLKEPYSMINELPIRYVHELQHAIRLIGMDKQIRL